MGKKKVAENEFDALAEARRVLTEESEAVRRLTERLDEHFGDAVEAIFRCEGRVIVCGMGKSGQVGRKITSTFASTGTPTVFLHPAEGLHGDLGVITDDDVAIAISYSGETEELLAILPFFKRFGVKLIAICGVRDSTLGRAADLFLDVHVDKEACPLGITPTTSSTATLAMGDALAMALLRRRGFKREDFAIRHPGGSLGRRLLLRVADLQHAGDELPTVGIDTPLREAIMVMSRKRLGMAAVLDGVGKLCGIITDGDLRRALEREEQPLQQPVSEFMGHSPKTIDEQALATEALRLMETHAITSLITLNPDGSPLGVIHIHDILKAGIK
jgi:arabinose-5-phosphate isomerase